MKQFSFSDMNRASGEILEAALIEPVALTKRGKEKLVILRRYSIGASAAARTRSPTASTMPRIPSTQNW